MYKQVILIRSDLKLSKGKAAAQSAHASVSAMEHADKKIADAWRKTGQKKVVLKVKDLEELMELKKQCDKNKIANAIVTDAGRTEVEPGTITALGVGPDKEERIDKITGKLKML